MFVGHYGPGLIVKALHPAIPLGTLFVAAQLVDVAWALLAIAGIEKFRIVPGITAASPLDLYYMPYTHSLAAALLWGVAATLLCRPLPGVRNWSAATWIGATVSSHWLLDLVVHRPDLPIYDDAMKVGLGLWNHPWPALGLEALLLVGGMSMYLRRTVALNRLGQLGPPVLAGAMLAIQAFVMFGPAPASPLSAALTALGFYAVFAGTAHWLDRQRRAVGAPDAGDRQRDRGCAPG